MDGGHFASSGINDLPRTHECAVRPQAPNLDAEGSRETATLNNEPQILRTPSPKPQNFKRKP